MPNPSFIPKYITKRLIPADAVKIEQDLIRVKFVNILSPIPTGKAPEKTKDAIVVKIDGQLIYSKDKKDIGTKIWLEYKNQKFNLDELSKMGNGIIPVGDTFDIVAPNLLNYKSGETHKIEFKLEIGKGFGFDVERLFQ
jgi:hypothetical protein